MKTKLYYPFVCALIIALSACSSELNASSTSSVKEEKTLLDLMKEKIKGFNVGMWPYTNTPSAGLTGAGGSTVAPRFSRKMSYKIYDKELHLIIDGVDVERFYVSDERGSSYTEGRSGENSDKYIQDRNKGSLRDRMEFLDTYLKDIKAEDVKSVQVISKATYNEKYKPEFAYNIDESLSATNADFAYVEVTTHSGEAAIKK
jgi:hypothetical protein